MRRSAVLTTWIDNGNFRKDHVWVLEFAPYATVPSAIIENHHGRVALVPIDELELLTTTKREEATDAIPAFQPV